MIFKSIETHEIDGVKIRIIGWQALALLKVYAGGPQDLIDTEKILKVRAPSELELKGLRESAAKCRLDKNLEKLLGHLNLRT